MLKCAPEGLKLRDLVDAGGKADRKARAAAFTVLLSMRHKDRAAYDPATAGDRDRGGTYRATEAGLDYLARKLDSHPEWGEELGEGVLETGAMRGETATVIQSTAIGASFSCVSMPAWVFGLAQWGGASNRASA
jgi:hypothetical protein